jgi:hypothetical protein
MTSLYDSECPLLHDGLLRTAQCRPRLVRCWHRIAGVLNAARGRLGMAGIPDGTLWVLRRLVQKCIIGRYLWDTAEAKSLHD